MEDQYIELYNSQRDVLSDAPTLLNIYRDKALEYLKEYGLPRYKSEDYQRTDLAQLFEKDWGINIGRLAFPVKNIKGFQCNLPGCEHFFCVVNDTYQAELSSPGRLPFGVFVGSLYTFAQAMPEVAEKYYARIAKPDHDGIVALNTMFAQDGLVVYVPKDCTIEHPIQLVQLLRSDVELLAVRRLLIIMEDNSSASLLICNHTLDSIPLASVEVVEIFAGKGCRFEMTDLEESSVSSKRVTSTHLLQQEKSNIVINGMTMNNGFTRNNYYCKLEGEYADLTLGGMAIGTGSQHIDNYSRIEHNKPNCHTNELFKYVLSDDSYGVFSGRILVAQDAQKTEAYQNNRNLLLSDKAKMQSKPQLEIYADDVKCSHGMTTGQLDEDALFYLRSRGIPADEAKMMLSVAFMEDVVQLVEPEVLQDRLREIIDSRFRGDQSKHCSDCGSCS